ncbi:minor tail protein [Mycobacterium phage Aminay]|uniref:Minor tail protein n=1 Tax=Mycobacterium phage Aminay TaxID=2250291 RepID=A0A345KV08_9CAUD|nr:minor tail protein [Mycobacterium phage Aminay]AXH46860.1 minor tail protein [Mycobacterium phage Aminay]
MTLPPLPPMPQMKEPVRNTLSDAMYEIAELLQYPTDSKGRRYDVRYLIPVLSFHLARAGCIIDPDRAVIKPRKVPPPAEFEGTGWGDAWDAIEWVGINEPESIDDELAGATVDDLPHLSPAARAELIRRLGGTPADGAAPEPDLDERTPWRVETAIHFED